MKVFLISYDLNKSGQDYNSLYEAIKACSYSDTWWHYLDSTWIIKSNLSVSQVSDKLKSVMDDNDSLLVIEVINNYAGWLPQKAWDYLKQHIFN
ncbi:hypothetical protein [Cellulosilyticum sp. I15G10I2]|uniref:hypothetical protein n=1 Tax=Cellulosilyticum sp. I15G10I2 TaxID=1892843 RepID=UPI00085CBF46|nr:hypothetical protein [Cellulosilyticum sp. I15G10I2]